MIEDLIKQLITALNENTEALNKMGVEVAPKREVPPEQRLTTQPVTPVSAPSTPQTSAPVAPAAPVNSAAAQATRLAAVGNAAASLSEPETPAPADLQPAMSYDDFFKKATAIYQKHDGNQRILETAKKYAPTLKDVPPEKYEEVLQAMEDCVHD